MHRTLKRVFLALTLSLLVPVCAWAQSLGQPGTVSASGIKVVKEKPHEMRMTVRLTEKAPTLKEALAKLEARTEAAKVQLEQAGASKEGLEVTDPVSSTEASPQEQRMRQMMMMRARGGGGRKPKQPPKSVTVSSTITARWPLEEKKGIELLEFCHITQEKVNAADLAGLNEKKTLTPEEEELAEEAAEMMGGYDGEANPAEPTFYFVGRISKEARHEATKEAFAKARSAAETLAAAAGAKLGKLSSLGESASPGVRPSYGYSAYGYNARFQALQQAMLGEDGEEQPSDEAISPSPEAVGVQVMVYATFALE